MSINDTAYIVHCFVYSDRLCIVMVTGNKVTMEYYTVK
jgi:hypothetical protein